MYLGQMIEKSSKKEIFKNPLHPYTIALLSAIPSVNVKEKKQKIILKGEIGSPVNPKPGCRFAPRCPFATDRCRSENPEFREVLPEHFVVCHRVDEMKEGKLHF
ncbi:MAG: peptide ABC transporter ATP-binding protein, partial [Hungatella sp.]|nr:peptide ABC transporter ATP-binding protein [Hungatella sp.]